MPSPFRLPLAPRWSALVHQPESGGLAVVSLELDGRAVEVLDEPEEVLAYLRWLAAFAVRKASTRLGPPRARSAATWTSSRTPSGQSSRSSRSTAPASPRASARPTSVSSRILSTSASPSLSTIQRRRVRARASRTAGGTGERVARAGAERLRRGATAGRRGSSHGAVKGAEKVAGARDGDRLAGMWELYDGKEQRGPLSEAEVVVLVKNGEIPPAAQVRLVGAEEWRTLRSHAPFAMALGQAAGGAPPATEAQGVVTTRPETSPVTWGCAAMAVGLLLLVLLGFFRSACTEVPVIGADGGVVAPR